ncbi:Hypothetical predicted protein [Pelobates cultripes]|uniref:Uncharacterized protein n=1 Tax=Pelobates cultripes TaxID=61616 RepID=A0AAD1RIF6_PELCU|nr:Hypothetical predicted protein [Pelobates cultripes]
MVNSLLYTHYCFTSNICYGASLLYKHYCFTFNICYGAPTAIHALLLYLQYLHRCTHCYTDITALPPISTPVHPLLYMHYCFTSNNYTGAPTGIHALLLYLQYLHRCTHCYIRITALPPISTPVHLLHSRITALPPISTPVHPLLYTHYCFTSNIYTGAPTAIHALLLYLQYLHRCTHCYTRITDLPPISTPVHQMLYMHYCFTFNICYGAPTAIHALLLYL